MYPEFVAIYIMLLIVIALLGAVLYFLMKLSKNCFSSGSSTQYRQSQQMSNQHYDQSYQQPYQNQYQVLSGSIVFCKHCATQFDASQGNCPNCGARR